VPELINPIELDFLCEAANIAELPYPLEFRSHGATMAERSVLRRQVHQQLRERDLVDPSGRLEPRLEEWLGVLAQPAQSIDSVFLPERGAAPVRALAATGRGATILASLRPDGALELRQLDRNGLISAVVDLLPAAPRGTELSITLPAEEFAAVGARGARGRAGGPPEEPLYPGASRRPAKQGGHLSPHVESHAAGTGGRSAAPSRASEVETRQALARLTGQPSLRGGQLAANSRDPLSGRRRSPVLAWFDNASGRYLGQVKKASDGREWTTVAPADAATLRKRLAEMLTAVTGPQ
jgi:ESX secretion-associated protein EspG